MGISGTWPPTPPDRERWRRIRAERAAADEANRLMDLAAFADQRLTGDETGRVAALTARDPDAIEDVLAARAAVEPGPAAVDERIIARAVALVPGNASAEALVIAFPQQCVAVNPWRAAASWSGLAAAMVLAGWLGFDLGSGLPNAIALSRGEAASASELTDSALPLVRDFVEGWQT